MKKVLLTSTALVAFAGAASAAGHAGVSLSGYAEMGIIGGDRDTQFHHDIDVKFSLTGESDAGFTFGATIDLDEVSNGISNTANPSSVFISGAFGTLTMGDTDGALDKAMTEVGALTAIADDHTSHAGYNGNSGLDGSSDGQVLRYDYSFGDLTLSASAETDRAAAAVVAATPGNAGSAAVTAADEVLGLGIAYNMDLGGSSIGLGLGYQSQDDRDIIGVSVSGTVAGIKAVLNYSVSDDGVAAVSAADYSHVAIGLTYTMDALSVHANYGVYDFDGAGQGENDGFGIAVNYDLGGGAVVMAGYSSGTQQNNAGVVNLAADSVDKWSLGLGLSF